jgi:hypothetical protein
MADSDPGRERKARRVPVSVEARLRHGPDQFVDIEIKDLSFYGFSAEAEVPVKPGAYVSVDLPVIGPVRARVAWIRGATFGAVFPTAVDVRKCVMPLRGA